jgi:hypothetical protein
VLASVGVVAALGVGSAGGLASSASARPHHRPSHTPPLVAGPPVTTASFTFDVSISAVTKHLGVVDVSGTGVADFANHAASITVTIPAAIAQLIPGGSAAPEDVNVVLSGGTVYIEVPALAGLVGRPWISVALPATTASAVSGGLDTVASALGNVDQILAFATAHHAKVTSIGSSTVDGTSVTGSQISARLMGVRIGATLWADASNRLVKASVTTAKGGGHRGLGLSATVDLSGYGVPVTITVPPASQVRAVPYTLVAQILGQFLQGLHLPRLYLGGKP